jgi:tetratricopeptide (TPR) repeat protein
MTLYPHRASRLAWWAPRASTLAAAAVTCTAALITGCASVPDDSKDWFDGGPMQAASPETLQLTARMLAAKGSTAQAGFLMNRLLVEYPDHLGTYTEGAEVLLIEGRVSEAIKWIDRGLERFPNHPILLNDRGTCYVLSANLPAATRDFEACYAADPGDADYVGNLALARALAGQEDEARTLWGRILGPYEVFQNIELARKARGNFASPPSVSNASVPSPAAGS